MKARGACGFRLDLPSRADARRPPLCTHDPEWERLIAAGASGEVLKRSITLCGCAAGCRPGAWLTRSMLPILIVLAARRVGHPDYVEARRIDERDAKREAIELDKRAVIIDHLYGYE